MPPWSTTRRERFVNRSGYTLRLPLSYTPAGRRLAIRQFVLYVATGYREPTMQGNLCRVLVVGREQGAMDRVTRKLESDAYIVTGTLSDAVALDLAWSTDFDALLIGAGVSASDRRYLATQVRNRQPSIPIVNVEGAASVLIQLRQALKEKESAELEEG